MSISMSGTATRLGASNVVSLCNSVRQDHFIVRTLHYSSASISTTAFTPFFVAFADLPPVVSSAPARLLFNLELKTNKH